MLSLLIKYIQKVFLNSRAVVHLLSYCVCVSIYSINKRIFTFNKAIYLLVRIAISKIRSNTAQIIMDKI